MHAADHAQRPPPALPSTAQQASSSPPRLPLPAHAPARAATHTRPRSRSHSERPNAPTDAWQGCCRVPRWWSAAPTGSSRSSRWRGGTSTLAAARAWAPVGQAAVVVRGGCGSNMAARHGGTAQKSTHDRTAYTHAPNPRTLPILTPSHQVFFFATNDHLRPPCRSPRRVPNPVRGLALYDGALPGAPRREQRLGQHQVQSPPPRLRHLQDLGAS